MGQPQRPLTLGVVADDFTGATDVASMLVRAGMRTVLVHRRAHARRRRRPTRWWWR